MTLLADAVRNDRASGGRILIASGVDAFAFGALTDLPTCALPIAFLGSPAHLLADYQVRFIFDPAKKFPANSGLDLVPQALPGLYRVFVPNPGVPLKG